MSSDIIICHLMSSDVTMASFNFFGEYLYMSGRSLEGSSALKIRTIEFALIYAYIWNILVIEFIKTKCILQSFMLPLDK